MVASIWIERENKNSESKENDDVNTILLLLGKDCCNKHDVWQLHKRSLSQVCEQM